MHSQKITCVVCSVWIGNIETMDSARQVDPEAEYPEIMCSECAGKYGDLLAQGYSVGEARATLTHSHSAALARATDLYEQGLKQS